MADNESTILDEDGEYADWIELYNPSPNTVNLIGYHISDDDDDLQKWTFPNIEIGPEQFLLIFASGKNKFDGTFIHTNFKISDDGEELILSNSLEIPIDIWDEVELGNDESFGRLPDGSTNKIRLPVSTPGETNNTFNVLTFSHEAGYYQSPIDLSINSIGGDDIYYTLDGSKPSLNSNLYESNIPLKDNTSKPNIWSEIPTTPSDIFLSYPEWQSPGYNVDKASIIRCASFKNGIQTSETYSKTYLISDDIFDKYDLPIVSLITEGDNLFDDTLGIYVPGFRYDPENAEWSGNYFVDEFESERPVHIEFFEIDGHLGFSQNGGVRIHGGKTRHAAQKSLKLYARKEYGEKHFNYPLIPQKDVAKYKRFLLQTTVSAWGGEIVIKDVLAHEVVKNLDIETMDHNPVIVFLNGEYWGIHHIRDRIDEEYLSYTTGLHLDSIEIDRIGNSHFFSLIDYLKANNPLDDTQYDYVSNQMDIDGFIDYQIAEMFLNNYDWPANNSRHWRPKRADGKWRWIFFDIDGGFGDPTYNMIEHNTNIDSSITWPNDPKSTFIFRSLIENDQFVDQFLSRYKELIENDFRTSTIKNKLLDLIGQYETEMPNHIKRWHFPQSMISWFDDIETNMVEFIEKRPCAVVDQLVDYFSLENYNVDCEDTTGTGELLNNIENLNIYPNPNSGTFSILNTGQNNNFVNLTLYNSLGQLYYSIGDVPLKSLESQTVEINSPPPGIYYLNIQSNNSSIKVPIVIVE